MHPFYPQHLYVAALGVKYTLVIPLLLLEASYDALQFAAFLPLHGLQDLRRTLGLAAGGALPSKCLTVLQDESMLVVPVENRVFNLN